MVSVFAQAPHLKIPFSSAAKLISCVDAQLGQVSGISVWSATLEAIHMFENPLFVREPDSSCLGSEERTRKMTSLILRRLREPGTQTVLANALGVAESTISRLKSEQLEHFCGLLAHLDLKIVPESDLSVDPRAFEFTTYIAGRAMGDPEVCRKLLLSSDRD